MRIFEITEIILLKVFIYPCPRYFRYCLPLFTIHMTPEKPKTQKRVKKINHMTTGLTSPDVDESTLTEQERQVWTESDIERESDRTHGGLLKISPTEAVEN